MLDSMVSLVSFISLLIGGRLQASWAGSTNELVTSGSEGNGRNPQVVNLKETLDWLVSQGIVIE